LKPHNKEKAKSISEKGKNRIVAKVFRVIREMSNISSDTVSNDTRQGRKTLKQLAKQKEGWLQKKGESKLLQSLTWKRRWFVLRDGSLHYYKDPKDSVAIASINLKKVTKIRVCCFFLKAQLCCSFLCLPLSKDRQPCMHSMRHYSFSNIISATHLLSEKF
jgi:hypothetical protein